MRKRKPPVRSVGIVLGLWLAGVFSIGLLARIYIHGSGTLYALAGAVLWPLLYFLLGPCRFVPKSLSDGMLVAITAFAVFGGMSVFVSPVMWQSLAFFCMTLLAFLLALQFNSNLDAESYGFGLGFYAFLTTIALVAFALYDYTPGLRLGNGKDILNPNTVGMVTMSVILSATAIRNIFMRYAVMVPATIVLILTDSRASTVAVLGGLFIIFLLRLKSARSRQKAMIFGAVALVLAAAVLFSGLLENAFVSYFAIHNKYRGLGTGFTGRFVVWRVAWNLFLENPILGIGFRALDHVVRVTAHNGYLTLLAEIGLPGSISVGYLVFAGINSLRKDARDERLRPMLSVLAGLSIGYLMLAMFERYLFNVGNPTSLIFMLAILRPKPVLKISDHRSRSKLHSAMEGNSG